LLLAADMKKIEETIAVLQWILRSIILLSIGYTRCIIANNVQNINMPPTNFCFDGNNEGK
jgi:hypothetical protein